VLDAFTGGLSIAYSAGPPFGADLLCRSDLRRLGMAHHTLRREAFALLDSIVDGLRIHGQPPALMLSFQGLESSLLLADRVWRRLAAMVSGEPVVGVPARDVVVVTGSRSGGGLAKARRCVDRVMFAGGADLLSPHLLVRDHAGWTLFDPAPADARPRIYEREAFQRVPVVRRSRYA